MSTHLDVELLNANISLLNFHQAALQLRLKLHSML